MVRKLQYAELESANLVVDAVYEGAPGSKLSGEPLSRLLPGIGNLGGFRPSGRGEYKNFVVLYTSGGDRDWPDTLDWRTGNFVYYGDNKQPGRELHDTHRKGNRILRHVYDLLHGKPARREAVPPFFVFEKHPTVASNRSVQFRGLAVPGSRDIPPTLDLVAVWKTARGQRFQNYRATFTVLDVPEITRGWIEDLKAGRSLSVNAPRAWRKWVEEGEYSPLMAESTTVIRSTAAQLPESRTKEAMLRAIWQHFASAPVAFEAFAARVFQMQDQRITIDGITRPSADGGRDAIGRYMLGLSVDPIFAEFSLEAKCYRPPLSDWKGTTVGVKDVSRLISRIRHRQFGVLVTTSIIARQAYEEVRQDGHPIVFLSGKDIVDILTENGLGSAEQVKAMLWEEHVTR